MGTGIRSCWYQTVHKILLRHAPKGGGAVKSRTIIVTAGCTNTSSTLLNGFVPNNEPTNYRRVGDGVCLRRLLLRWRQSHNKGIADTYDLSKVGRQVARITAYLRASRSYP